MTYDARITAAAIAITLAVTAAAMWMILRSSQSLHDRWFDLNRHGPTPDQEPGARPFRAVEPVPPHRVRDSAAMVELWLSPQRSRHPAVPASEVAVLTGEPRTPHPRRPANRREP